MRIDYIIFDAKTNQKLTTASTTQVAVSMQTREMQLQTPLCWQSAVKTHPTFVSEGGIIMRLIIFILGLFLSSVSFCFSEADLVKQLQQPQSVQGNFIQHRYLKALNKPIEMQGQFALLAQKGYYGNLRNRLITN